MEQVCSKHNNKITHQVQVKELLRNHIHSLMGIHVG